MKHYLSYLLLFVSVFSFGQEEIALEEIVFQAEEDEAIFRDSINPEHAINTPSLTGSLTDILKTLPYVSVNTELSSQYMVRGGNYDENLIYINGVELYHPQLIRAGKQEGLSFLNPNMTAHINFMAGGWEPQFGDKLSSVLDVIYKTPQEKFATVTASLLGGNVTAGLPFKNGSILVGGRYLNRDLILDSFDEDTDFNPEAYDVQAYLNYKITPQLKLSWLGNFNSNTFNQEPKSRKAKFGTLNNPIHLNVYYNGKEEDHFETKSSTLSLNYEPHNNLNLDVDFFATHAVEEEYYDILAAYYIREQNEEKNTITSTDVGGQIDYGRNDLDALILGVQHRGNFKFSPNHKITWGIKVQKEDVKDRLNEWQMIDSVGYSVQSFDHFLAEPLNSKTSDLNVNYAFQGSNDFNSMRYSSFLQYNTKFIFNRAKVLINAGFRAGYWDFNEEWNFSPRFQIAVKPDWVTSQLFRLAIGKYIQPAFYKDLKKLDGSLNEDIKAQKSIHFLLGHDYEFFMFDRPFKLTTEIYYKHLTDLIPYYLDNVRIKYTGENNSKGKAYGIDVRLYGEVIPGADSWLSLSYARSKENIDGRGWIDSPTDRKFKASLFFQDYMPMLPSFKVNVNLIYANGLPNGAPPFTDPYQFQRRLPDYKRVDLGMTKEFFKQRENHHVIKSLELGVNVFNLFNISNVIANQWLRDVNTGNIYAVPSRLTGRFFNTTLNIKF